MEDESESKDGSIEVDEPHSKTPPPTHIEVQVDTLASTQAEGTVRKTKITKKREEEIKMPTHFDDIGLTASAHQQVEIILKHMDIYIIRWFKNTTNKMDLH